MEGLIRKIVIGRDPKDGMAYYVGMNAGGGKVAAILQDESYLYKFGKTRYLVYIEDDEGTQLWKGIDDMPCILEFDLNF
tara:strand:+ start:747 stop:983 length:237 start_codon:yes stop_codon:yes gene_type:complete